MTLSTERALSFAILAPAVYLVLLALGRWLKRRVGVPFGMTFQVFCVVVALYLPLKILDLDFAAPPFDAARDLGALAAILGSVAALALVRRFVWEGYFAQERHTEIPKLLRQLAALLMVTLALLLTLHFIYGKDITGLVFTSTVAVGVIGFAMQDLLGNIIAGIAIEVGKPFKAGDWLAVDNYYAEVIEVNWRSTRLRTNDHVYLDLPNGKIVKNTIINLCYPTRLHAMRIRVGVEYAAPPNRVKDILKNAAVSAIAVVPTPPPKVFMVEFGDSAVIYEVKFWIEDHSKYNDCCDSIRTHIWYGLNRANIKIPFPIRTLQMDWSRVKAAEIPDVVRETVRRQPLFQCLDDAQTERLLSSAHFCRFGGGEALIEQGVEGNSMFVLLEGKAEVLVQRDGSETRIAELGRGDHFGEMSLLTGEQRSATVRAVTDCEVVEIDKHALGPVLQDNKDLLRSLSELLARRRIETEGILASSTEKQTVITRQREDTASFLAKLYSFFEL